MVPELWGVIDTSEFGDGVTILPQFLLRDLTNGELYLELPQYVSCVDGPPLTDTWSIWNAWYDGTAYYPNVATQGSLNPRLPFTTVGVKDFITYWVYTRLTLTPIGNATYDSVTVTQYNISMNLFDPYGATSVVSDSTANNDR